NYTRRLSTWFSHVLMLITLFSGISIAYGQNQSRSVSGVVLDKDNEVIVGASVHTVGSGETKSTVTNQDGKFTIDIHQHTILRITFLGFVQQQVNIDTHTELSITLHEESQNLDEVVVTAMGISQEAKSLSYARQSIDVASMTE